MVTLGSWDVFYCLVDKAQTVMTNIGKDKIHVGFLFSNGQDLIYKVNWLFFSDLISYKDGEPTHMNEVHVDVYKETKDGKLEAVKQVNFMNIKHLYPLPVKLNYLKAIGFIEEEFNGNTVLKNKNVFFSNLSSFKGVQIMYCVKNDNAYPVTSIHEVQQLLHFL